MEESTDQVHELVRSHMISCDTCDEQDNDKSTAPKPYYR